MTVDLGIQYRAARLRVAALVGAADVDPDMVVPATPRWTLHDVVAHLAGVAEDATNGNMDGAPGDPWTAAQVERGRDRPIADLLAEWAERSPFLEAFFSSPGGMAMAAGVVDVHTHEADLRHALGLPLEVPADLLGWWHRCFASGSSGVSRPPGWRRSSR